MIETTYSFKNILSEKSVFESCLSTNRKCSFTSDKLHLPNLVKGLRLKRFGVYIRDSIYEKDINMIYCLLSAKHDLFRNESQKHFRILSVLL